jgi:hypothetical protein
MISQQQWESPIEELHLEKEKRTPVPGSARLADPEARNLHYQEQVVCQEREDVVTSNSRIK